MYHFSWLQLLSGPMHALEGIGLNHDEAITLLTTWLICFVLLGLGAVGRMGLNKAMAAEGNARFVPSATVTVRNMWEIYVKGIYNLSRNMLSDKDARAHYWLIGGLFIYILFGNLMAVLPGGLPPTTNISNNFAMALVVFVVFNAVGFSRQGFGYIKHMMGPVLPLMPLILVIELVGLVVRPVSLSLRLMGNMTGDHTVFGVMSDLVPVVVPSIFLGLGMFVSFLQAFVFTLLSVIYIGLSIGHGDDHH